MNESRKKSESLAEDISWGHAPYIAFSGMCMGTADVVPGVSGGTMALALGIYRDLLAAINSLNADSLRALLRFDVKGMLAVIHWRFLTMLAIGIGVAVAVMVKIVKLPKLITTDPQPVYAVFFGLVLASAMVLARRIPNWSAARAGLMLLGTGTGFAIVNLVPVSTPESAVYVFFCGAVAICVMLLPGISGSFVLLILGKYEYVLEAVSHLDLKILIPFGLGCGVGILSFSRFLGWLMARWPHAVGAFLTGLLFGSLWRIWPYQELEYVTVHGKEKVIGASPYLPPEADLAVIGLMMAGFVAVVLIEVVASRRQRRLSGSSD